ncbi:hypothetical protein Nos7524_1205 [Nostoc sp. PCC 7524]|uniref:hypothetical protein n=1 Tax=Nostoc sp. (strain ATCC 29411 / PCC 7524) TaxID=28072 RepID=UPI00029F1A5D|nr:hypothetical protein [Nostoc sp. PCC 7524]AFY47094.1 hypothetical protein Nos7524_1205 [Nostoc sp. PCC 7524]
MNQGYSIELPCTQFVEMPCVDCEPPPLFSGTVLSMPLPAKEAVKQLLDNDMKVGNGDFNHTYTVGHYGNENQIWDYSHYEIYEPIDPNLPSMVVLRYRPRNPDAAKLFYGD